MSLETIPYNSASSARSLIEDLRLLGRSLTYDRNSKGPNTVPWGTPEVTWARLERLPSYTTDCERFVKNDSVQLDKGPRIP